MLGTDERALRVVWTIFLFGLLLAIVYFIRETLILFAAAIFFAYMLAPVVNLAGQFMPKRRNLAIAVVYIIFVALLVTAGTELVSNIAEQATSLATRLPKLLGSGALTKFPLPAFLEPIRAKIILAANKEAVNIETSVVPFVQEAGSRILSGLGAIAPLILIPILGFFLLKDGAQIRSSLIGSVDDGHDRTMLEEILDDTHVLLSRYIRALVLLSIASFVAWIAFLTAMGYPYQLLLAGLAGILEFIPVVGPAISLVITLIVCAVTGSGGLLWVFIFWICFRLVQDYVLNPYLMSSGVELHPLLVLFGVLAGERIGGVPGMFFSVPVLAILRAVFVRLRQSRARKSFSSV